MENIGKINISIYQPVTENKILAAEGENPEYNNSIITAVFENGRRFLQRIKNNPPIYKKLDKSE